MNSPLLSFVFIKAHYKAKRTQKSKAQSEGERNESNKKSLSFASFLLQSLPTNELRGKMMSRMQNRTSRNCVRTDPEMNISDCRQMAIAEMSSGKNPGWL